MKSPVDKIIEQVYDGLRTFANRHAISKEQADDFLQEGLLTALATIPKYQNKSLTVLVLIVARSAYNKIKDMQSEAIIGNERHAPLEHLDFEKSDGSDPAEHNNTIRILKGRLSTVARRVFEERLDPSWRVLNVLDEEKRRKLKAREDGALVMNVHNERVTDSHIAQALGYSKATVSRAAKEIRQEGEKILLD